MKLLQLVPVLTALASIQGNPVPELDGKIVGGTEVDIKDYPYQVSVRFYDWYESKDFHLCGGSILDASTVLTAAHCVEYLFHPSQCGVRIGNTNNAQGQYINVSQIRQHKDYNMSSLDNDMAILKLAIPLNFTDSIQPIELQPKGVEVPAGTVAWVSGWGIVDESSEDIPDNLRAVDVAVITDTECIDKYGAGIITSRMMCAQTLNHDSCQGDSGGPIVANGKLIGVVSWGYGCADPEYPGVYAKVSNMYDWISENR